jgi:hypothetical protein
MFIGPEMARRDLVIPEGTGQILAAARFASDSRAALATSRQSSVGPTSVPLAPCQSDGRPIQVWTSMSACWLTLIKPS